MDDRTPAEVVWFAAFLVKFYQTTAGANHSAKLADEALAEFEKRFPVARR